MSGKIAHKKNVGQMMGQISYRQAKKPCKSRLFPVDLDAPYRARTCDPWIKSPLLYQLS